MSCNYILFVIPTYKKTVNKSPKMMVQPNVAFSVPFYILDRNVYETLGIDKTSNQMTQIHCPVLISQSPQGFFHPPFPFHFESPCASWGDGGDQAGEELSFSPPFLAPPVPGTGGLSVLTLPEAAQDAAESAQSDSLRVTTRLPQEECHLKGWHDRKNPCPCSDLVGLIDWNFQNYQQKNFFFKENHGNIETAELVPQLTESVPFLIGAHSVNLDGKDHLVASWCPSSESWPLKGVISPPCQPVPRSFFPGIKFVTGLRPNLQVRGR